MSPQRISEVLFSPIGHPPPNVPVPSYPCAAFYPPSAPIPSGSRGGSSPHDPTRETRLRPGPPALHSPTAPPDVLFGLTDLIGAAPYALCGAEVYPILLSHAGCTRGPGPKRPSAPVDRPRPGSAGRHMEGGQGGISRDLGRDRTGDLDAPRSQGSVSASHIEVVHTSDRTRRVCVSEGTRRSQSRSCSLQT